MTYSNDWLTARLAAGQTFDYVYFWGHRPHPARITKSCLSQWFAAGFTHGDVYFPTAEHWMMYQKAQVAGDAAAAAAVLAEPSARRVKAIGRRVRNYDDRLWTARKYAVVVEGSVKKFTADPALREYLLGTGDAVLVEASPYDNQWGIGMDEAEAKQLGDPARWRGTNLLGWALMEARDRIRAGNP